MLQAELSEAITRPQPTQKPPIPTLICGREDGWRDIERDVGGDLKRERWRRKDVGGI